MPLARMTMNDALARSSIDNVNESILTVVKKV